MLKANQREFRVEKVIKKKDDKLHVKWKGYDDSLTVGLMKRILLYKMSCFPEPYSRNENKTNKTEANLSSYAAKSGLMQQMLRHQILRKRVIDLVKLISDVDDLDIEKLKTFLVDITWCGWLFPFLNQNTIQINKV